MKSEKLVQFLLEHNKKQSEEFTNPDAVLSRKLYRSKHPTEITALKCMDGRLNLSIFTKTPIGIIRPFRNIGGQFDLGWPFFGLLIKEWVEHSIFKKRTCIVLITYHYSKSNTHLGCRGFNYDTSLALTQAKKLKEQFERVFGKLHSVVYPVMVGIETDEDALIIHGENRELFDLSKETSSDETTIKKKIEKLFPAMQQEMIEDFLPLLVGNIEHVKEIRETKRPAEDTNHKEFILGIGRGFDWLHLHNKALLIGPFSYNLKDPISKAAGILLDNIKNKRIDENDGVILIVSAVHRKRIGTEYQLAIEKSISLAELTIQTIQEQTPELIPHLSVIAGTVDMNTRKFTPLPINFIA